MAEFRDNAAFIFKKIIKMEGKNHEILPGLTTTPRSDWRGKVEEMKKFDIKRIALFPTFLEIEDRKILYTLLEEIEGLEIPHVHLREQDMERWEMEWFESRGTKVYNIHISEIRNKALLPYADRIYIENHKRKLVTMEVMEKSAGICLDFQHLEGAKKERQDVAQETQKFAENFEVGCCHVSALPKFKNGLMRLIKRAGGHYLISLDEVDYVMQYKKYFPQYISIELENTFESQLEVKKYLEEKILNN